MIRLHQHLSEKKPGEFLPVNANMLNLSAEAFHTLAEGWHMRGGDGFSIHSLQKDGGADQGQIQEAILMIEA